VVENVSSNCSSMPPFKLKADVKIHMYCSEAPCGDASMELIMRAQEDSTPWKQAPETMPGRGDFSQLGVVRRKPARADAPQSLSKACTDKMTLYQFLSLLRGITSLLIDPSSSFLATVTLPKSQYVEDSIIRAFSISGRLREISPTEIPNPYGFTSFQIMTTDKEFSYSRRSLGEMEFTTSNKTTIWTPMFTEILNNGILQGRKASDPKAASRISRRRMWEAVAEALSIDCTQPADVYGVVKSHPALEARRQTKAIVTKALSGWKSNHGDEVFTLEDKQVKIIITNSR